MFLTQRAKTGQKPYQNMIKTTYKSGLIEKNDRSLILKTSSKRRILSLENVKVIDRRGEHVGKVLWIAWMSH